MSKELETLLDLKERYYRGYLTDDEYIEKVNEVLSNYIKNYNNAKPSEPSEALKYFKKLKNEVQEEIGWYYTGYVVREQKIHKFDDIFDIIELTLIKAQELKKENVEYKKKLEIIKNKNVDYGDISFCEDYEEYKAMRVRNTFRVLPNITFEDLLKNDTLRDTILTEDEFNLLKN